MPDSLEQLACLLRFARKPVCTLITTFEHAVLLCLRCASKACGRGEPQGRPGGALHVWTMGHSLR